MKPQEKYVALLKNEVGYLEKSSAKMLDDKTANAGILNYTKYARDVDAAGGCGYKVQAQAWCATFTFWGLLQLWGVNTALSMCYCAKGANTAGCTDMAARYKTVKAFYNKPEVGDQVFFWKTKRVNGQYIADRTGCAHTGVVSAVRDGRVYTIEGNTSGASGVVANGGGVCEKSYALDYFRIAGYGRPNWALAKAEEETTPTKSIYTVRDGVHIIAVPVSEFKIKMVDKPKKSAWPKNYANAGYFGYGTHNGVRFSSPSAMLVCEIADGAKIEPAVLGDGKIVNGRYVHPVPSWSNQFWGKKQSALVVNKGSASITELPSLSSPEAFTYAITGIPVMRKGKDVSFVLDVKPQGWYGNELYATWHTFLGLKGDNYIYVMGMRTSSANMITSAEAFKKFKALGFTDVIKLDGGGSFIMNVDGKTVASTTENRQINNIIVWGEVETAVPKNGYSVPTATLRSGSKGEGVKWLQTQLNLLGYSCGTVDGDFGSKTLAAVKAFQKAKGLVVDGIVGPATRAALK